jgi:PTH1 family peptidyl-tRNA hydrolase
MLLTSLFHPRKVQDQKDDMKYLIAGLGNIGDEYAHTRHNIGFDVADALVAGLRGVFTPSRFADTAVCRMKGRTLVVIKPTTYMNLSGKAVRYWMDKEKIPLDKVLVIVDDLALPLDAIRIRPGGSDAGHNGLKSIQEMLGTDQYTRLRFGIGSDYPRGRQVDFVLSPWTEAEKPLIRHKIEKSVEIIETFVLSGVTRTMNEFNHRRFNIS